MTTVIERGTIALELSDEFPGLHLLSFTITIAGAHARSPRVVRARLLELSDRFQVAHAPALRRSPVPSAYRAFCRQIGVDPDTSPTPLDEAIRERLRQGAFRSWGFVEDAVTISSVETLVPLWAMDGAGIVGGLGVRGAERGERLPDGRALPTGQLVVADANGPLAALLEAPPQGRRVTRSTRLVTVYCPLVPGVSQLRVEEALLLCGSLLTER